MDKINGIDNIEEVKEIVKEIIKERLLSEIENPTIFLVNNKGENNKEEKLIAIDGSNNCFTHPLLEKLGCNLISVIAYKEKVIEKKTYFLFEKCSKKLKIKQIKKIKELKIFGEAEEIIKKLNEKDYTNELIEEEKSFILKIRNLLEIAFLIKYSNDDDYMVVRDGLFYLPELIEFKYNINKYLKEKSNIFALAKKSKLLRDDILNFFLQKYEKEKREKQKSLIMEINEKIVEEYYEKNKFLFDSHHFFFSYVPLSYYHLEIPIFSEKNKIIEVLINNCKKGKKGYPKSLIMADKIVKISNNLIRRYENKLLKVISNNFPEDIKTFSYFKRFQIRK